MARRAKTFRCKRRGNFAESIGSGSTAWCADRNFAHMAFAFALALPWFAADRNGQHGFWSSRCRRRIALSSPSPDIV